MKQSIRLMIGVLAVLGLASAASAQTAGEQEISTAITHAHLAAQQDSADKVHLHLHHVINCLVGENGDGFSADAGNPCHGMGNGALNDLPKNSAMEHEAMRALGTAQNGLKQDKTDAAAERARAVESMLHSALKKEKKHIQAKQKNKSDNGKQEARMKAESGG